MYRSENFKMKTKVIQALVLVGLAGVSLAANVEKANAVVCARGVYRAGCVGPHGAVGVRRPAGVYHGGIYRGGVYRGGGVYGARRGAVIIRR